MGQLREPHKLTSELSPYRELIGMPLVCTRIVQKFTLAQNHLIDALFFNIPNKKELWIKMLKFTIWVIFDEVPTNEALKNRLYSFCFVCHIIDLTCQKNVSVHAVRLYAGIQTILDFGFRQAL